MIAWRKSSYSGNAGGANCVEVGMWRKSSRSGSTGGNCVEVGHLTPGPGIAVRDTKDRQGAVFTLTPNAWAGFVTELKSGTFDPA